MGLIGREDLFCGAVYNRDGAKQIQIGAPGENFFETFFDGHCSACRLRVKKQRVPEIGPVICRIAVSGFSIRALFVPLQAKEIGPVICRFPIAGFATTACFLLSGPFGCPHDSSPGTVTSSPNGCPRAFPPRLVTSSLFGIRLNRAQPGAQTLDTFPSCVPVGLSMVSQEEGTLWVLGPACDPQGQTKNEPSQFS